MATSSTSTVPKKINRYKLSTLSLLLIFLLCLFLFNRRAYEPKLFHYTDLISQTQFHEKYGDLRQPVSSLSNVDENVDENVTVYSESLEPEFQEESNEEHVLSKSDLDDKTAQRQKNEKLLISADSESQDDFSERNGKPISLSEEKVVLALSKPNLDGKTGGISGYIGDNLKSEDSFAERTDESVSSNKEITVPNSSKSNLDDKTKGKSEYPDDKEKSQDNLEEINDEFMSSNEEITHPISSKSDIDDKIGEKPEHIGPEEKSSEEAASSDTESGGVIDNIIVEKLRNCDISKGTWVKNEAYPLYKPGSCPYVDEAFDCLSNGRPDSGYTQWRWKPDDCDLPRFNATDFLVRLRGKRLMLVGDSMNRNQFESLLCLLREGLTDKSSMYETRGYKITKGRGYYIFKFKDYDCTVEFVRSHFLVREGTRINGQGNSNPTLSIDRIDKTAARWQRADILVFNTGHWWTHGKTARGKNYYKEGNYTYPRFDAVEAYRRAIKTWATWIKKNIKRKSLVFYRGYSSAHFRGGDWDSGGTCNGESEPVVRGAILDSYPQKMKIVDEVIKETQVPVVLLNVTRLTNYRKDGHPSVYGKNVTRLKKVSTRRQDCSHWCLPGVPDAWNELIYTTLVARQT